jgi:hypothetical protein
LGHFDVYFPQRIAAPERYLVAATIAFREAIRRIERNRMQRLV